MKLSLQILLPLIDIDRTLGGNFTRGKQTYLNVKSEEHDIAIDDRIFLALNTE